jgi:endonuclease I
MKTAVEWLEKIRQGQKVQPFDDYEWEIAFNHAKEMEKEQIIKAYLKNHLQGCWMKNTPEEYAEQYYKQTYESNT